MDDSLDSVETVEDGIQLYRQLDSLWGIAGMQARKWVSNAPEVVSATPKAERATELQISEGQEPVVKTLGVSWNSLEDTFTVITAKASTELHLTKRNVLRKIATIFDPLGFVWLQKKTRLTCAPGEQHQRSFREALFGGMDRHGCCQKIRLTVQRWTSGTVLPHYQKQRR